MKLLAAVVTGIMLVSPFAAFAQSVADKQEMQKVETEAAAFATKIKAACGNQTVDFKYNWTAYDTLDYTQAGANMQKTRAIGMASGASNVISNAMVKICADAIAKTEAGKITEIDLTPRTDKKDGMGIRFTKQGTVLNADYYPFGVSGSQDVAGDLKKTL